MSTLSYNFREADLCSKPTLFEQKMLHDILYIYFIIYNEGGKCNKIVTIYKKAEYQ